MNYIRSTFNPKGLYIWADEDVVYITKNSEPTNSLPKNIFEGLIRKYKKSNDDDVQFKGFETKEVWEIVNGIDMPQTQISYKDWKYTMWFVTWEYICSNVK